MTALVEYVIRCASTSRPVSCRSRARARVLGEPLATLDGAGIVIRYPFADHRAALDRAGRRSDA